MFERLLHAATLSLVVLCAACDTGSHTHTTPKQGDWHMELDLGGRMLPFQFTLGRSDSSSWSATIHNASEAIRVHDIALREDSFFMRMPLFDSEFKGVILNDSTIRGFWHNYLKGPEYRIPFTARAGIKDRFIIDEPSRASIKGSWEVHFSKGATEPYNAIGLFDEMTGGRVTGTFVTETGDYRFLEGVINGDSLHLSSFDGSHAFLFSAGLHGDSLVGRFWSGSHWQEPWVAQRNPNYELRDPDSLTFLKEGYEMVDFHFPDLDGRVTSLSDERFRGKVVMVQVMGSWCPNCVDETVLLNELYDTYSSSGLEVLAVAFEKYPEQEKALAALRRFKETLGVGYPIVYGGIASKEEASAKLPFLDHVMSYPTCIFVDRRGTVRRIRTGFYGPGTGEHYKSYDRNLRLFIEELLAEPAARSELNS